MKKRAKMSYYQGLINRTLKEAKAYRVNFFFSFLVNFVPIIGFLFLVHYLYGENHRIGNYSYQQAITYYIFVRFFDDILTPDSWWDIENDIRSGDLNFHLIKPYSYFWHNFVIFYFLKLIYFLVSLPIVIILISFMEESIFFPTELITYIYFIGFTVLALILSFQITFLISILSFWLIDNSFVNNLLLLLLPFITGVLFPLDAYPPVLKNILENIPFAYLLFTPSKIFLENYTTNYLIHSFTMVSLWIVILYFTIKILFNKGLMRYEANG